MRFGGRRRGSLPATAPLPWQPRPRPSESGWPDARTSHRRSPTQSHEPERKTDPFNFVCSPPRGRRDQRLGEPARVEMPHGQGGACKRYICRRLPDRRLVRRTSGTRRIPHYTGNAHTLVQGSPHRLPRGRRKRPRRDPRGQAGQAQGTSPAERKRAVWRRVCRIGSAWIHTAGGEHERKCRPSPGSGLRRKLNSHVLCGAAVQSRL